MIYDFNEINNTEQVLSMLQHNHYINLGNIKNTKKLRNEKNKKKKNSKKPTT